MLLFYGRNNLALGGDEYDAVLYELTMNVAMGKLDVPAIAEELARFDFEPIVD